MWNVIDAPMPPVRARSQPKTQRREEDGQARRDVDRGDVTDGEDRGGDEPPRSEGGPEDAPARRPLVVEPRLEVAAVEGLLGQRDDEELAEDLVRGLRRLHREREVQVRHLVQPPRAPAEEERDGDDRHRAEGPRARDGGLAREVAPAGAFRG